MNLDLETATIETIPQSGKQIVLIAIPTFRRSARLKSILPHIEATLRTVHTVNILIVDNNTIPVEQKFVQKFAKTSKYPVSYVHEPKAGVSNARNAALDFAANESNAPRFLAFLDDDMEITPPWIDSLVSVSLKYNAGLVFGPLTAKFKDAADPRNPYLASFYTRSVRQAAAGISNEAFGTGGCLIDLKTCVLPTPPFDTSRNESGGEDDKFFETLHNNGAKYGWAPDALCYECVPPERTTPSYIARRNFSFGQGPSRIAASKGIKGIPQLIRHMT